MLLHLNGCCPQIGVGLRMLAIHVASSLEQVLLPLLSSCFQALYLKGQVRSKWPEFLENRGILKICVQVFGLETAF
jgi:hypothetical protein